MCRMVRLLQTARKGMQWHPPIHIHIHPISDSSSESDTESDVIPGTDSGSEDHVPAGPEIEVPAESDDEVYILEPPPIPVVDLVTASEEEGDRSEEIPEEPTELEETEGPNEPEKPEEPEEPDDPEEPEEPEESEDSEEQDSEEEDSEEENSEGEDLDLSEDTERLAEFEERPLSVEEYRLRAMERGKRVNTCYWGAVQRPAKRVRFACSPNPPPSPPSPDRSVIDESGYEGDREISATKRTRGFWDIRP
jgi:hypothetical protein